MEEVVLKNVAWLVLLAFVSGVFLTSFIIGVPKMLRNAYDSWRISREEAAERDMERITTAIADKVVLKLRKQDERDQNR